MRTTLITPTTTEPLALAETKLFLRVDFSDEDTLIANLIVSARQKFEQETGRQLTTATWKGFLDSFPQYSHNAIEVAKNPLLSVASVLYVDSSGVEQTWDSAEYDIQVFAGPKAQRGMISPKSDFFYPITRRIPNAVIVNFNAGYGPAASDVPQEVKLSLLSWVAHLYKNREAFITGTIVSEMPGVGFDAWKELEFG